MIFNKLYCMCTVHQYQSINCSFHFKNGRELALPLAGWSPVRPGEEGSSVRVENSKRGISISLFVTHINLCVSFLFLCARKCAFSNMTAFSKPKFKTWSRKWHNLRFACWNCWSYSNERHAFCKSLGYDVLALT